MSHVILIAEVADGVDLILHESDKRRNHNRRSLHNQSRELVAKRFAAAGRHKHEHVVAVKERFNDGFLIPFEGIEAEMLFKRCF